MNVLVAEPTHGGHRLNIVGLMLDALARLPGVRVTFDTSPSAPATEQFRDWIAPRLANVTLRTTLTDPLDHFDKRWAGRAMRSMIRAARETSADHVLMPTGDGTLQMAAIERLKGRFGRRRGVEFETMMLRGKFAYERRPTLRQRVDHAMWFATLALAPFDRVYHMDPVIYEAAIARRPSLARKFRSIPDPVDPIEANLTIAEARLKLALPTEGRILGCVGFLEERKGINLLIRSFARNLAARRLRADDRLLLVGAPEPGVAKVLDGEAVPLIEGGRLIVRRQFVSDVEMSNAISAMNLVVTAYPGHVGSASIALRAAAQRRPVLADRSGWCEKIVPLFGLGSLTEIRDDATFDSAMLTALDATDGFTPDARADRLVRYSAVANFQAHWMQRLRERLNLPAEPKVTWAEATA